MKWFDNITDWVEDLMYDVWWATKLIIRGLIVTVLVLSIIGFVIFVLVAFVALIL